MANLQEIFNNWAILPDRSLSYFRVIRNASVMRNNQPEDFLKNFPGIFLHCYLVFPPFTNTLLRPFQWMILKKKTSPIKMWIMNREFVFATFRQFVSISRIFVKSCRYFWFFMKCPSDRSRSRVSCGIIATKLISDSYTVIRAKPTMLWINPICLNCNSWAHPSALISYAKKNYSTCTSN